jgi:hypothetical protein
LELGARNELEIRNTLEKDVEAERWTGLDRVLQAASDEGAGVVDLRPTARGEDSELRRLLVGRVAILQKLGLADEVAEGQWTLKPSLEATLRELSIRGDIIKTMHRAMSRQGTEPDVAGFALHSSMPSEPVQGRLVERGLDDELKGSAYAVIEGLDGRTHHLRFASLDLTGDASPGAIVESRAYQDAKGQTRTSLAVRSDLNLADQIGANGATWLDRRLLDEHAISANAGFGAEAQAAMQKRADHLASEGLAQRRGQGIVFARGLLATLRKRELDEATAQIATQTGLAHHPLDDGDMIAGTYRQRVSLASGRFAMIDDGMGFQLVPWRPVLEQHLGEEVKGRVRENGIQWNFERKRDLGL